jgi:phosphoribosyl 1,2-cyclic phosphate phosphodiesterase
MVELSGLNILLDCGPDFRSQMLVNDFDKLDAVLISHEHYDHTGGLDDLRPFCIGRSIDVYAELNVTDAIRLRMPYAFRPHRFKGLPEISLHNVGAGSFTIAGAVEVIPIRVMHGCLPILGFRIGGMAYLTDLKTLPESEYDKLGNLQVLIVDALRRREHPTHQTLANALKMIERIRPSVACLVHLSHSFGLHADEETKLPAGVRVAYDGMIIDENGIF